MARRKQGAAEDFMDLVAMLPWWGGVALALVSYLFLHRLAVMPSAVAVQPGQMGDVVVRSMVAALANPGQYIAPFICLLGAFVSFMRRRKRQNLVGVVTEAKSADALNGMPWSEFEMLVGEAFRLQGYQVKEQGGTGADGGIDLVLRKGSETFLVQCKQWKAFKVGVDVVRQLYGVMAANGATGGFVITSGSFTADAQAFASGRNVKLVDGPKLFGLIQQAKASVPARNSASASKAAPAPTNPATPPSCPECQSSMVLRTARKGTNAGSEFWGCPRFPACRGTR